MYTYGMNTVIRTFLCTTAALLALSGHAHAWEPGPWTREQVVLQGIFTALLYVDVRQTMTGAGLRELNPLLGSRPTDTEIVRYFTAAALLHGAVSAVLPSSLRTRWQYVWIGIESHVVWYNWQLGLTLGF